MAFELVQRDQGNLSGITGVGSGGFSSSTYAMVGADPFEFQQGYGGKGKNKSFFPSNYTYTPSLVSKVDGMMKNTRVGGTQNVFGKSNAGFGGVGDASSGFLGMDNTGFSSPGEEDDGEGGGGSKKSGMSGAQAAAIGSAAVGVGSIVANEVMGSPKYTTNSWGMSKPPADLSKHTAVEGATKGAATGLQMGASFGPWGMLAGLVIGGVGGGIMGKIKGDKRFDKESNLYNIGSKSAKNQYLRSQYSQMFAKEGMKLKVTRFFDAIEKKERIVPIFRIGGKLVEEEAVNVIPDGKLHKEKNSLGNGDKGIPVVDGEGTKLFELEKEELVLHKGATEEFEMLMQEYEKAKDKKILVVLGKRLSEELLTNTKDYSEKYGLENVDEIED